MKTYCIKSLAVALLFAFAGYSAQAASNIIPAATGTALDGRTVSLPRDLPSGATILILGFSQHSADTTTAWEIPVRTSLATPSIAFYDMPFLEDAPGFIRPFILRSIRRQVPDALRPNFLPVTTGQAAWKQTAGYTRDAPDAAYVLLVDRSGQVCWQTHEPFSAALFAQLSTAARKMAAGSR